METIPCPVCGSTDFARFLEVPDRFDSAGEKRWPLANCLCCGLIMLNPRPGAHEMKPFYPSGLYGPHLVESDGAEKGARFYLAARRLLLGYRAGIVLKNKRKPLNELSVLEVGCSTGELLGFLNRKKGIPSGQLAGIETDTAARKHAGNSFGLEVHSSIPGDAWEGRKFDRIVLWHALEHIHAVGETLTRLSELLGEEGVMVIALPNPGSTDAGFYRENWIAWDAPRHLYHFTPMTLGKLLEKHRFIVSGSMPYFPDTLYNLVHSEKLTCRKKNKPFNAIRLVRAGLRTAVSLTGYFSSPSCASGMVYFARKA
ncbi:MAG: class I SAM-dependent methyltransferase [Chlorobiaceae bacterium]|nr:class I SAM-dependent methyltransferase [Chlorobiaceae bacterium]